jgi:hypothetical protein
VAPPEPVVPVLARVVLSRLPVPVGPKPLRKPAAPLQSQLPGQEDLALEPAGPVVPVELLLSRRSFSAVMAGITPLHKTKATYDPVPRSR